MSKYKAFRNTHGKGFQITFPNGVMLSTQFGWGNYCENSISKRLIKEKMEKIDWESDDCEIAIINSDGKWITKEFKDKEDDVMGWVTMTEWLEAFDWARTRPNSLKGPEHD